MALHLLFSRHCTTAGVETAALLFFLFLFFFSVLLQAYRRASELEPRRLFSLVQSGLVLLALGNYTEAQGLLQSALEVDSQHVPALFAAAQLLLASAKYRIAQGTPGRNYTAAVVRVSAAALATATVPVCPDIPAHIQLTVRLIKYLYCLSQSSQNASCFHDCNTVCEEVIVYNILS